MIREFIKKAEADPELAAKIKEVFEKDDLEIAPALIRLGEEYGFHFTETDIGKYLDAEEVPLEEDDLEMISGGCSDNSTPSGIGKIIGQWAKTKCFTADCMVSTPEGEKSIRDIREGDEVVSLDPDGKKRTGIVEAVMGVREMPVVKVVFENGKEWYTTDTQWFYCGGDDYACVMEDGGKKALTEDGGCAGVTLVEKTGKTELVYDFVVNGLNVYFVNGIAAEGFSLS